VLAATPSERLDIQTLSGLQKHAANLDRWVWLCWAGGS